MDLFGKEIIARGFSLTTSTEHQDGSLLVEPTSSGATLIKRDKDSRRSQNNLSTLYIIIMCL
jgi:hypothetical protein